MRRVDHTPREGNMAADFMTEKIGCFKSSPTNISTIFKKVTGHMGLLPRGLLLQFSLNNLSSLNPKNENDIDANMI